MVSEDERAQLRKRIKRLVSLTHYKLGFHFADVHRRSQQMGGSPQEQAGPDELRCKPEWLQSLLQGTVVR